MPIGRLEHLETFDKPDDLPSETQSACCEGGVAACGEQHNSHVLSCSLWF